MIDVEILKKAAIELEECDGVKKKFEAQKIVIRGYDLEIKTYIGELRLVRDSRDDCVISNAEKDAIIYGQDDKLKEVKTQRNISAGLSILLIIGLFLL